MPDFVLGYEQTPLPGVSMRYSFDDADAPTQKKIQYYEMLGTRALWSNGWKAATERAPFIGTQDLATEKWQPFHTDEDRAQLYDAPPLEGRSLVDIVAAQPEQSLPPGGLYTYYPGTTEVPEFSAANTRGRSVKILAQVAIE